MTAPRLSGYCVIAHTSDGEIECVRRSPGLLPEVACSLADRALPYGQGWESFVGARAVKAGHVPGVGMAVSYVEVTAHQDKYGRKGLLRSYCYVVSEARFRSALSLPSFGIESALRHPDSFLLLLDTIPTRIWGDACRHGWTGGVLGLLLKAVIQRKAIARRAYCHPAQWAAVEEEIRAAVCLIPACLLRWVSFATLALSLDDPSVIMAVPLDRPTSAMPKSPTGVV